MLVFLIFFFFFFQAEDGIRDLTVTWSSDVCSSDLTADVLAVDRYWILPNRFAVQHGVSAWSVRAARIPTGRELLPFYVRRVERSVQRRRAGSRRDRKSVV